MLCYLNPFVLLHAGRGRGVGEYRVEVGDVGQGFSEAEEG